MGHIDQATGQIPSRVQSTNLHLSDFAVMKMCVHLEHDENRSQTDDQCSGVVACTQDVQFTLFDEFCLGICDYSSIRQLVLQNKDVETFISLKMLRELLICTSCDISLLIDLRWKILSKLRTNEKRNRRKKRKVMYTACSNDIDVEDWMQITRRCIQNHYSTSWVDYISSMSAINQWLTSLATETCYRECILNMKKKYVTNEHDEALDAINYLQQSLESDNPSTITCELSPLSFEIFQLQLHFELPGQELTNEFSICSLHDAVMMCLCLKKLCYTQLSIDVAKKLLGCLEHNKEKYMEHTRIGILKMKSKCSVCNVINNKQDKRLSKIKKKLYKLSK